MNWNETTQRLLELKQQMTTLPDKIIKDANGKKINNPEYISLLKPIFEEATKLHLLRIQMNSNKNYG